MKPRNPIQLFELAEQKYREWCVTIDTTRNTVEDLFRPQYWIACTNLKTGDRIRCIADNGSYDFFLKVDTHKVTSGKNAITVSMFPKLTPELIAAADGTAASQMVPTIVFGKPVPRTEPVAGKGTWRVVGFDGHPVGDPLPNEAVANVALGEYLAAHKITGMVDQPAVDARTGELVPEKLPEEARPKPAFDTNISYGKRKEIAKREEKLAKRREIDERNKTRTAERLAAEAASGDAA